MFHLGHSGAVSLWLRASHYPGITALHQASKGHQAAELGLCREQRREGVIPQSIAVQRRLAAAGVGTTLQSTGQAGRKAAEPAEAAEITGLWTRLTPEQEKWKQVFCNRERHLCSKRATHSTPRNRMDTSFFLRPHFRTKTEVTLNISASQKTSIALLYTILAMSAIASI